MATALARLGVVCAVPPVTSSHVKTGAREKAFRLPQGNLQLLRDKVGHGYPVTSGQSKTCNSRLKDLESFYSSESDVDDQSFQGISRRDDCEPADVVILTNGPGEVATWVKPVLAALRRNFPGQRSALRISVVLAPCPHSSGAELNLVLSFPEVDRCQGPEHFWQLLLCNRTADGWGWHKRGVCIFLGGDQFNALLLGKRLGYKTVVYAEDAVRWPGLVDMYAVRTPELLQTIPSWLGSKCQVVGDLFADAVALSEQCALRESNATSEQRSLDAKNPPGVKVLGLLPGSKDAKLLIGVPYFMAVADVVRNRMGGNVRFVLPLAPTVSLESLAMHADRMSNPFIAKFNWSAGAVKEDIHGWASLVTEGGIEIEIRQQYPSYEVYKQCSMCLTTVGTNTAELGSLGIPMLVILPTHALEVFKGATGGLMGLLSGLPGWCGEQMTRLVNMTILKSAGYISWPNRWAGEQIVPEIIGLVEPAEVADKVAEYLSGDRLEVMRRKLCALQKRKRRAPDGSIGAQGAANEISREVLRLLSDDSMSGADS